MFESMEGMDGGITGRPAFGLRLPYRAALGVWPAFILLLAFSWIELVYPNPAVPYFIAWLALVYSLLTFACMFLFGRECWLEPREAFTSVLGPFTPFSPNGIPARSPRRIVRP